MDGPRERIPFVLKREGIHPQERLPVPELVSEEVAALGWPLELQGTGTTDYDTGELAIYYPCGDLYISTAVVIHEVGHWRQCEIDPSLRRRDRFVGEDEMTDYVANEADAYERGWLRVSRYIPEMVVQLDAQLAEERRRGAFVELGSFEAFYRRVEMISQRIIRAIAAVEVGEDEGLNRASTLAALKQAGGWDLFQPYRALRVGRRIDTAATEEFLLMVAKQVANE